jgi:hypothetical protein
MFFSIYRYNHNTITIEVTNIIDIIRMYDDKVFTPKSAMFPGRTPKKLDNSSLFGWIAELYFIDDNTIIDTGGYDVLFLVRFYRLSVKIFLSFAIYAWGVLLPINGTGGNSFLLYNNTILTLIKVLILMKIALICGV